MLAFLPKAWNVVLNPLAGRVSDRTTSRIGPRRPYVLCAGVAVGIAFAVMFAGPLPAAAGAAWAVVGYFVTATAFAFFQSPYAADYIPSTTGEAAAQSAATANAVLLGVAILPAALTALSLLALAGAASSRWSAGA